jgi:hypothetical protein
MLFKNTTFRGISHAYICSAFPKLYSFLLSISPTEYGSKWQFVTNTKKITRLINDKRYTISNYIYQNI